MSLVRDRMRGIVGSVIGKCGCSLSDTSTIGQLGLNKTNLETLNVTIKSYFNVEIPSGVWDSWQPTTTISDIADYVESIM